MTSFNHLTMIHVFILPVCSLLVNLQYFQSNNPEAEKPAEWEERFDGRIFAIRMKPEAIQWN